MPITTQPTHIPTSIPTQELATTTSIDSAPTADPISTRIEVYNPTISQIISEPKSSPFVSVSPSIAPSESISNVGSGVLEGDDELELIVIIAFIVIALLCIIIGLLLFILYKKRSRIKSENIKHAEMVKTNSNLNQSEHNINPSMGIQRSASNTEHEQEPDQDSAEELYALGMENDDNDIQTPVGAITPTEITLKMEPKSVATRNGTIYSPQIEGANKAHVNDINTNFTTLK